MAWCWFLGAWANVAVNYRLGTSLFSLLLSNSGSKESARKDNDVLNRQHFDDYFELVCCGVWTLPYVTYAFSKAYKN